MYKIIRYEGKTIGIELTDRNMTMPIDPNNTDFKEWRKENPNVDLSDQPYEKPYDQKRYAEYNMENINAQEMAVAMWEYIVENRPEAMNALQAKRQAIKNKYPKV